MHPQRFFYFRPTAALISMLILSCVVLPGRAQFTPSSSEVYFNAPPLPRAFLSASNPMLLPPPQNCLTSMPICALLPRSGWGLTHQTQPKIYIYVEKPKALAKEATFRWAAIRGDSGISDSVMSHGIVEDGEQADLEHLIPNWELTIQLPERPGLLEIEIPEEHSLMPSPSDAEQRYQWSLTVSAPSSEASQSVGGLLDRVALPSTLRQRLEDSSNEEKAILYGQYGLWYDAVAIAAQLQQEGNENILKQLLSSSAWVGLNSD